ncbi:MAG: 4-oxalomesaconate tautomerase [Rhodobacteraceae bacterium]|nr:MAG: 4-oxalomesaconate tautomerase [Paracoccaceae bacterium]
MSKVLAAVIGAGHPNNIDGLGGGVAVTTKVAMLSASAEDGVDVDYFFGQVAVDKPQVDYKPTCGNILVGVGPAAIEMGLVPAKDPETLVRIRAVNTGALVEAVVQTPGGQVRYDGDIAIDGVSGTAAPVALNFLDVVGSKTGAMLPTGRAIDVIDGIEVTCIDVAMPMMIARAQDLGITGYESCEELDADTALFARMEALRLEAGRLMGLGDVSSSVTPKIGLIAPPRGAGHFTTRYFMPWSAHPTLAVTGSQCLAACALMPGTVADGITRPIDPSPAVVRIEHPVGVLEVTVTYERTEDGIVFHSAGLVRTARLIARGEVMVPEVAFR